MGFLPVAIAQLAESADPLDPSPTWTTLKALLSAKTDRGRSRSTDQFSAGRANCNFDNRNRDYDPTYTGGPYGANLVPDKQFRVLVGLNLLTEQQSSLEAASGGLGWAADTNCTVARSTSAHADGAASLALTSVAAGDMTATTPTGTAGIPVIGDELYTAFASVRAATSGRVVRTEIKFYDTSGTLLSTVLGDTVISPISDPVGSFTATPASVVGSAPADGFASMRVTVLATAGAGEVHYADMLGFCAGTDPALRWSRGTGLTPIFTGLVDSWAAGRANEMTSETACVAYDVFKILSYKRLRKKSYYDAVQALSPDWFWRLNDKLAPSNTSVPNAIVAVSGPDMTQVYSPASTDGPLVTDPDPALSLDADKGFIVGGTSSSTLGLNNSYSVAFWIKTSSAGIQVTSPVNPSVNPNGTAPIIWTWQKDAGNNARTTWGLWLGNLGSPDNTTVLYHAVYDPVSTNIQGVNTDQATVINDGHWHHVVITRDSAGTHQKIYVDGVLAGSSTGTAVIPAGTQEDFQIAHDEAGPTGGDHIAFDTKDMAWWFNRTLSGAEVLDLYNTGVFPSETVADRVGRCLDIVGVDPSKRSLDAGITLAAYKKPLHSTAALAHMSKVVGDDGGALFADAAGVVTFQARGHAAPTVAATIADNPSGTDIPASPGAGPTIDDNDLYDEVSVTGDAIQPVLVNSGTDGLRTDDVTDWQGLHQADAAALASELYSRYSTATARVREASFEPQSLYVEAPNRAIKIDLLARITHRTKGVGHVGSASSLTQYVEHIAHDVTPGKLWSVDYSLSPYP